MQETQGTRDGRGSFALSSQGGARPVEHEDHPGPLSELGGDTFNSVTGALAHSISTEVSVAGLAAGDEASAQDGHSVETSAANLAAGGHAALALAGAHASETSLACMIRRR
mmetsp:Transcript_29543/g.67766  ORF Transcript_29543/g.67766 Transcript_29543/m.67766 type:complete len:111 (+) Transcript_29543:3626-3958(+)